MGRLLRVPWPSTPSMQTSWQVATVDVQTLIWKGYLCTTTTLRIRHPSGHRKGGPIRGESGDTPVAMATDHRASLLPFAAALLVLLLAGGAAADDASSDDDAGTSRTPGCSNKFQLVMALPLPLAYSIRGRSSLIRSLPVVVGFGVPGVL